MEWDELITALRTILDAEWTTTPISYQNEEFTAPDQTPWVYLEVLSVDSETTPFGSTGLRIRSDLGLIGAHVFVPTGTGAATAYQLARTLGDILALRTLAPGVETEGRSLGGAGSSDDEGNWYRVSCSVPVSIHTNT